jgi:hypothetical protein
MEKILYYVLFVALGILGAALSVTISQEVFAGPIPLPTGKWVLDASGQKGELNILPLVGTDGLLTGTVRFGIGTTNEYTSKISGFWDDDAWKITFLKENTAVFKDPNRPVLSCNTINPNTQDPCHGRDQVYTGFMFGGLPCPPSCTSTGTPITLAGSFEAFGGTTGTGATADRSVFGWVATK